MNNWIKLALPLGLGLIAGILNWSATMSKIRPVACVSLAESLEPGDEFSEDKLRRVEIGGDLQNITKTVIPWRERAVLYGRKVTRAMQAADIVFWRDAAPTSKELLVEKGEVPLSVSLQRMTIVPDFLRVGQHVGFLVASDSENKPLDPLAEPPSFESKATQYVGPFRILAVGSRTSASTDRNKKSGGDTRVLTVAAKFLPNTRHLDAEADRLVAAINGLRSERAVGVVLHYDKLATTR